MEPSHPKEFLFLWKRKNPILWKRKNPKINLLEICVFSQAPLVKIGQIIKTRGLRGELKIYPYTESYCMQHYCSLSSVWVGEEEEKTIEYKLVEARIFKNFFLFLLQGIDTVEKASALLRKYFFVPENNRAALQENEILVDDLVGSQVVNVKGEHLGKVVDFFHNGANGVCEVFPEKDSASQKKFLFPVIEQVLLKINKEKKLLVVELLEE